MKTTKMPAATIKVLFALAQQSSARVLIVQDCAFLLDGKHHEHKYIPSNAFSILRAKAWITTPAERGQQLAECAITSAGKAAAASIQALQNEFHQLEFDLEMIDNHIRATQLEFEMHAAAEEIQKAEPATEPTVDVIESQAEEPESTAPQRTVSQCLYDLRQHCLDLVDLSIIHADIDDLAKIGYIPFVTFSGNLDVSYYGNIYGNNQYEQKKQAISDTITKKIQARQLERPAAPDPQAEPTVDVIESQAEEPEAAPPAPQAAEPTPAEETQEAAPPAPQAAEPTPAEETQEAAPPAPQAAEPTPAEETQEAAPPAPQAAEPTPAEETQEAAPPAPQAAEPTPAEESPAAPVVPLVEQVRQHMPLTRPDIVRALVYGLPEVSAEQAARCHRIESTRESAYYIVESEHIQNYRYKVSYSYKSGFSCTCTSGQQNFIAIAHPSGVCMHVLWSLAASLEARMHARRAQQVAAPTEPAPQAAEPIQEAAPTEPAPQAAEPIQEAAPTEPAPQAAEPIQEAAPAAPEEPLHIATGMHIKILHACNHTCIHHYTGFIRNTLEELSKQLCPDCAPTPTRPPQETNQEAAAAPQRSEPEKPEERPHPAPAAREQSLEAATAEEREPHHREPLDIIAGIQRQQKEIIESLLSLRELVHDATLTDSQPEPELEPAAEPPQDDQPEPEPAPRKRKSKEERQAERAAERAALTQAIKQLRAAIAAQDPEIYPRYQRIEATFDRFSETNKILILHQRDTATDLESYNGWKNRGYCVRHGEHSIRLYAPHPRATDAEKTGFHFMHVFDISQVEPEPQEAEAATPTQETPAPIESRQQVAPAPAAPVAPAPAAPAPAAPVVPAPAAPVVPAPAAPVVPAPAAPVVPAPAAPLPQVEPRPQLATPPAGVQFKGEPVTYDVLDVLKTCQIDAASVILPQQLERKLYKKVNEALERIGGKWNRKAKAHLFEDDPRALFAWMIETGEQPPKNPTSYFPTSDAIAARMAEAIPASARRILEPSAGTGSIARAIREYCERQQIIAPLDCCEIVQKFQDKLQDQGFTLVTSDFLQYNPQCRYDAILMNSTFFIRKRSSSIY